MARSPIQAAGGIVFRSGAEPLIAVVRLSKGDDWVLPKGKLNPGETPKAAAEREVWEETGFAVSVHEFLGKLKYPAGGRQKVVHFWRMEASKRDRDPMSDVRDVDWLPIDAALDRLTRTHERDFLADIGPLAAKARRLNGSQPATRRSPANGGLPTSTVRKNPNKTRNSVTTDRLIAKRNNSGKRAAKRLTTNRSIGILQKFQNWVREKILGGP